MRFTVKQAAQSVQVSPSLVYRWIKQRRLACFRLGSAGKRGRILIDPADLEVVIRESRQERHPLLGPE